MSWPKFDIKNMFYNVYCVKMRVVCLVMFRIICGIIIRVSGVQVPLPLPTFSVNILTAYMSEYDVFDLHRFDV